MAEGRFVGARAPCPSLACDFERGDHLAVVRAASGRQDPEAGYWLARSANELARRAFDRLAALPPSPELHQFRAERHTARGRHPDAVEELKKALGARSGDHGLLKQLGSALYRAKSYEEAARVLETVARREPSADILFLLGSTHLLAGRTDEAVRTLERAVTLAPDGLAARGSLGRAYMQRGHAAAAIPHLEAALPVDEDGSLHYLLARAYQATGQTDRAGEMLAKYAAIVRRPEPEYR